MNENLRDDLQVRILRLLDGDLGDEAVTRLDSELRASSDARALYFQLVVLHSALENQGISRAAIHNGSVISIGHLYNRQRWLLTGRSLMIAAAVLLLSLCVLWFVMPPRSAATLAVFRVGPDSLFTLIHSGEADLPVGNVLGKGSRLRLSQGTTEGSFASGVNFVIEGPCDLTVLDNNRISLEEGIAWFEVSPQAVGFTVETAKFEIVDHGTIFGVVAPAGGRPEVHVNKGLVEVISEARSNKKAVLKAGTALRLHPKSRLQTIPLRLEQFTKVLPEQITIPNPSFELDENTDPGGHFNEGERQDLGGNLSGWKTTSGRGNEVHVGWREIDPSALHPYPPAADRKSQALSLISGAGVHNLTSIPWSSLRAGDKLTLTLSLGMRAGLPVLDWNEYTFFGLTAGSANPGKIKLSDTVANSGMITHNPATGTQSGDGTFKDVSFSYVVQPADTARPGNIGILIQSQGTGGLELENNQSFFDHVRLHLTKAPNTAQEER